MKTFAEGEVELQDWDSDTDYCQAVLWAFEVSFFLTLLESFVTAVLLVSGLSVDLCDDTIRYGETAALHSL